MHSHKKILVFPAGSEIGLEIYKSVSKCTHFKLIGGTSLSDHTEFIYKDVIQLPLINRPDFISFLNMAIEENGIDAIYPTMDMVIFLLAKHASEIKCKIIAPEFNSINICFSKSATYNYLKNIVPVPILYVNIDEIIEYPVFAKPDKGYGSRGVALINSIGEALSVLPKIEEPLILEYLPGDEYTIDCFTDRKGRLLYIQPRIRSRTRIGISVRTTFVSDQDKQFEKFAELINNKLSIRGAWFFQLKKDSKGQLKLLEIGLRIAGSSSINRLIGVNLPLLTLYDAFEKDVQITPLAFNPVIDRAFNIKAEIDLSFDNIFIDYDDCLIINGEINTEAISLLFNGLNFNKKIFLISKHKQNLQKSLIHYRLHNIFDGIFHLKEQEKKSTYIKPKSIFIDDSYSERSEVHKALGIPVFSTDVIPLLNSMISWKKK